jgi:hypothetical protein
MVDGVVPLAVWLGIETGMRPNEYGVLNWRVANIDGGQLNDVRVDRKSVG